MIIFAVAITKLSIMVTIYRFLPIIWVYCIPVKTYLSDFISDYVKFVAEINILGLVLVLSVAQFFCFQQIVC